MRQGNATPREVSICLLLWLLLLCSAVAVVYSNHICRMLYSRLSVLEQQNNAYQVEWGRYLLEQSTWASLGRVEKIATTQLQMRIPENRELIMVVQ